MAILPRARYWIWLIQAFLRRHIKLVVLGIILSGFIAIGGYFLVIYGITIPSTVTIGLVTQPTFENLPPEILRQASVGLTTIAPDGQPLPGIASAWTISTDRLTYRFNLTPNLTWVDNSPVSSSDLNYYFKDAQVTIPASNILEIKLKESYAPLPVVVSRPVFKKSFIGTGPYRIVSINKSDDRLTRIKLQHRFPHYPSLVYQFYPTETAGFTALKLGEIKTLSDISSIPDLDWPFKVTSTLKTDRFVGLFFNTTDPVVSDKSFRQALAYGISQKSPPGTQRAIGPISIDSWANNQNLKTYDYDFNKAKQMMAKLATPSASTRLTITTFSNLLTMADQIKSDWQKLGLTTDIHITSSIPDNFQVLLITQAIPPDPDQYNLWHSTQDTNITKIKSPKVDKLLEDGRQIDGLNARKKIYWDFQKALLDELPVIFLYYPISYSLSRP